MIRPSSEKSIGAAYAVAAFLFWGAVPVYWRFLSHVPPLESLLHRIVWSSVLLLGTLKWQGRLGDARRVLADRRTAATLGCTTLLIASNWFLFIWSVNSGHLLDTTLGYFLTPLVNVTLGVLVLGERLSGLEKLAAAVAAAAVAHLFAGQGGNPWIALTIGLTWGLYGLLRKRAPVDSLLGLAVETTLLALPSAAGLAWLASERGLAFGSGPLTSLLLIGTSLVTSLPLLWFGHAARRIEMKSIGFAQYLSPTCHFLLAVTLFGEPLTRQGVVTFALVWTALALYSWGALRRG